MCGTNCHFVSRPLGCSSSASKTKSKKEEAPSTPSTPSGSPSSAKSPPITTPYIIPRQNKGLCTSCDVKVWLVRDLNLTIKWCKGCKNFRQWASFGEKSRATKCTKCRERQKEKYASQKGELKLKRQSVSAEKKTQAEKEFDSEESDHSNAESKSERASDDEIDAALGLKRMMSQN